MNWIATNLAPIVAITLINVILAGFVAVNLYDKFQGNWRRIFASLPTPTLGIASSYGVYAFNQMFAPKWVAVVMAAAYEITYIGIAALDILDDAQRERGMWIARSAASISFVQNALAGLFFFLPELEPRIRGWDFEPRLRLIALLAILHAAQVWIAYNAANLTLHQAGSNADYLAAKQVQYPAPEPVKIDEVPNSEAPNEVQPTLLPDAIREVDNRYSLVANLREFGGIDGKLLPWRAVSKRLADEFNIHLSHQSCANIYNRGVAVEIDKHGGTV